MAIPTELRMTNMRLRSNTKQTDRRSKRLYRRNYPWQDTVNWEYVSSDQKLIKEGYKAPIHDFVIEHPELGDITQEVLEDNGYTIFGYRLQHQ